MNERQELLEAIHNSLINGQFTHAKDQMKEYGLESVLTDYMEWVCESSYYLEDSEVTTYRFCSHYQTVICELLENFK